MSSYQIKNHVYVADENSSLVGAPFFFIVTFVTFRLIVRKLFFENSARLISFSDFGISIPKSMLFPSSYTPLTQ